MKKRNKKALSPVVASVLLVALVLVLASIIFLWARGFVSEQIQKFGENIDGLCEQVSFDAELYLAENAGRTLDIANRGNIQIHSFDIKEVLGGNSIVQKFNFPVAVGESVSKGIAIKDEAEKIVIYPALLGNVKGKNINKIYTCTNQGVTIKNI